MNNLQIKIRILAVAAVIFTAYNAVVFTLPLTRGSSFWTAYLFTVLAMALSLTVSLRTIGRSAISAFYRWPIMYVTWVHLASQLAIGAVFIVLPVIPAWIGAITGVIPLSLCLGVCITAGGADSEIERIDRAAGVKTSFLRSLRDEIEDMIAKTEDGKLRIMLARLAEELRYSDPMSDLSLAGLEDEIKIKTGSLGIAVSGGLSQDAMNACGELRRLLAERNRKCLSMKDSK
jgi:hypothetical protein